MINAILRTCMLAGSLVVTTLIPGLFRPDISGVWQIDLYNEVASEQITVNISQSDAMISGSYVGSFQITDLRGSLDGRNILFEYIIDGTRIVYVGQLEGKLLSGTYYAGDFDQGTFKGRRVEEMTL